MPSLALGISALFTVGGVQCGLSFFGVLGWSFSLLGFQGLPGKLSGPSSWFHAHTPSVSRGEHEACA